MKTWIYQIAIVSLMVFISSCSSYVLSKSEKGAWSQQTPTEETLNDIN